MQRYEKHYGIRAGKYVSTEEGIIFDTNKICCAIGSGILTYEGKDYHITHSAEHLNELEILLRKDNNNEHN